MIRSVLRSGNSLRVELPADAMREIGELGKARCYTDGVKLYVRPLHIETVGMIATDAKPRTVYHADRRWWIHLPHVWTRHVNVSAGSRVRISAYAGVVEVKKEET